MLASERGMEYPADACDLQHFQRMKSCALRDGPVRETRFSDGWNQSISGLVRPLVCLAVIGYVYLILTAALNCLPTVLPMLDRPSKPRRPASPDVCRQLPGESEHLDRAVHGRTRRADASRLRQKSRLVREPRGSS